LETTPSSAGLKTLSHFDRVISIRHSEKTGKPRDFRQMVAKLTKSTTSKPRKYACKEIKLRFNVVVGRNKIKEQMLATRPY
jgi:hypothetical protein